jgi:hypothetical protein
MLLARVLSQGYLFHHWSSSGASTQWNVSLGAAFAKPALL